MFGFWRIAENPSYAPFAGAGEEIITGFGTQRESTLSPQED